MVVEVEIYTAQEHKNRHDGFDVGSVKMSDAVIVIGESSAADAPKGMDDRIKNAHAPKAKQKHLTKGETQVNAGKRHRQPLRSGRWSFHNRTFRLGGYDALTGKADGGEKRDGDEQDADAACPGHDGAPEQEPVWHGFYR